MVCESKVIPVATTIVSWNTFLKYFHDFTGHSPSKGLDSSGQKLSDHARFIVSLEEAVKLIPLDPLKTLETASTLDHLSLSFIIISRNIVILKLNELTNLHILSSKTKDKQRIAYCTGTLRQWKEMILLLSKKNIDIELRYIANLCFNILINTGLKYIFAQYQRKSLGDNTYLLVHE
ncbi:MAG: hypothetical protein ACFFCQ_09215 [Promethearchaeota archaeon]